MYVFVANLLKCNFCDHLIIVVFMSIPYTVSARDFSRAVSAVRSSLYCLILTLITTQSPHARKKLWYPGYIPQAFVTIGSSILSLTSSSEIFRGRGYAFAG